MNEPTEQQINIDQIIANLNKELYGILQVMQNRGKEKLITDWRIHFEDTQKSWEDFFKSLTQKIRQLSKQYPKMTEVQRTAFHANIETYLVMTTRFERLILTAEAHVLPNADVLPVIDAYKAPPDQMKAATQIAESDQITLPPWFVNYALSVITIGDRRSATRDRNHPPTEASEPELSKRNAMHIELANALYVLAEQYAKRLHLASIPQTEFKPAQVIALNLVEEWQKVFQPVAEKYTMIGVNIPAIVKLMRAYLWRRNAPEVD